eukprot:CAMPEP_0180787268 /NCGR_PEP_ID=MMETSP1038_2-20121128/51287_1 /TAXON_ID=632150 /ORGANISM="Azadinium spinosum, Strain 3D9" /LENGTH=36 /DNA_ID= /DNA_START= /DNA_END= /DNA_ORIENTATION=
MRADTAEDQKGLSVGTGREKGEGARGGRDGEEAREE